jgi:hypothetical protein
MTVGEPSDDAEGSYCFEYRVKIPLWGPTAGRRNASKPPVFGELSTGCRNHLAWAPSNVARSLFELHGFPQRLSNLIRRTAPLPDGALSPLHPVSICELETRLRHVEPAGPHIGQIGLPGHDGASCVQPVVLVGMHRFGLVVDAHGLSTGGGLLEFYENAFGVLTHGAFKSAPVLAGCFGHNASEHHCGAALRALRTYDGLG